MKKYIVYLLPCLLLVLLYSPSLYAQSQQSGQPLYFPQEKYKGHPPDESSGGDPYLRGEDGKKKKRPAGGYGEKDQYTETTETNDSQTTNKTAPDKKKESAPPQRSGQ